MKDINRRYASLTPVIVKECAEHPGLNMLCLNESGIIKDSHKPEQSGTWKVHLHRCSCTDDLFETIQIVGIDYQKAFDHLNHAVILKMV